MELFVIVFALAALISLVVGFLLLVGGVNSKAEDEYWAEFLHDTPTTDVNLIADDTVSKRSDVGTAELPKAA